MIKRIAKLLGGLLLLGLLFLFWQFYKFWFLPSPYSPPIDQKAIAAQMKAIPDKQSVFVYSKDFAQRFGLDANKALDLDKGMYAMELVIIKNKFINPNFSDLYPEGDKIAGKGDQAYWLIRNAIHTLELLNPKRDDFTSFHMDCYLNLYVDSKFDIAYPQNGDMAETKELYFPATPAETIYTRSNNEKFPGSGSYIDPKLVIDTSSEFTSSFQDKAFFATQIHQYLPFFKKPIFYEVLYKQYKKNMLPGINYLSLGMITNCGDIARNTPDGHVLLEKSSGKNYAKEGYIMLNRNDLNMEDFYVFRIPSEITDNPPLKATQQWETKTFFSAMFS